MTRVRAVVAAASAALLLLLVPGPLSAQTASPSSPRPSGALPTDAELRIKQAVEASFKPLAIQNGIILVPRSRRAGVDNIELRDGMVAVNGTVVTGGELRQRLGSDADPVLELSYLDAATQRRLLLGAAPIVPPAEGQPPAAAVPPVSPGTTEPGAEERPAPEERQIRHVSNGRVRIGGSITVDEDEEVNGAVVAVGGSVDINGRVRDAVVAVGGDVRLGPRAEVNGDVTTVGGTLTRDPSAIVQGQVNEVAFRWPNIRMRPIGPWGFHVEPWWSGTPWRTVRLLGSLVRMGLFAVLCALVLLVAPRGVERIDVAVRSEPWKAALVGFFAQVVFVPLLVLTVVFLAISIIGIPLLALVPFAVLAFFVALLVGFTGAASAVSHAFRRQYGHTTPGPVGILLVGLLLIWALTIVGRLMALPGGPFAFVGGLFLLVGFLVEYAAWTIGLGGTIITRFGRYGRTYPPPVPPPLATDGV